MAAYVQSAQTFSSGNTVSLLFPTNPGAGHALVVAGRAIAASTPTTSCTDSQGNAYVHAAGIWNGNSATQFQTDIFVTANSSAAADTVTYTATNPSATTVDIAIHEYSGLITTNAGILDPYGSASAIDPGGTGSNSPSSGSTTPINPCSILFGAFGFNSASTAFTPGNMGTGVTATVRENYSHLYTEDVSALSSASYQANGTLGANDTWSALLVTLVAPHGYLCPIGAQAQFFTNAGAVLASGKIATYLAGTSTATATYTDQTLSTANANPIILSSAGRLPAGMWQFPGVPIKVVISDSGGTALMTIDDVFGIGDPAAAGAQGVGQSFYAQVAAEAAAGVNPTNYSFPPYCVDRYATNAIPGVTPMDGAFNAAVKAALSNSSGGGGATITYGQTGRYLLTNPINCAWAINSSDAPGITLRNIGSVDYGYEEPMPNGGANIILSHSGIGFDCTGNGNIQFIDLCVSTLSTASTGAGNLPMCAVMWARNSIPDDGANSAGVMNRLIRPRILGKFSVCCLYNFGSEGNVVADGFMANYYTGSCAVMIITANNTKNMATAYTADLVHPGGTYPLAIAPAPQSTTVHDIVNMQLTVSEPNIGSDVVILEGVAGYHQRGGWMNAAGCRSMWYVQQAGPATSVTVNTLSPSAGAATSATLSANWAGLTGSGYSLVLNNGMRAVNVTLTNGSPTATWSTAINGTTGTASVAVPSTIGDIEIRDVRFEHDPPTVVSYGMLFGPTTYGVTAPAGITISGCRMETDNAALTISSLSWASNTATVTTSAAIPYLGTGATFLTTIVGVETPVTVNALSPSAGAATSATLSANWAGTTGSNYSLVLTNGATAVNVTLTNGSATAAWSTAVNGTTGAANVLCVYDGTFIATVTGTNTFTYSLASNPGSYTSPGTYTPPSGTVATIDSGATLANFFYEYNTELNTKGIQLNGALNTAVINSQTVVIVPGTLSRAAIIGTPANWFIGTNAGTNNFASISGGTAGVATFPSSGSPTSVTVTIPTSARIPTGSAVSYVVTLTPQTSSPGNLFVTNPVAGATNFAIGCSAVATSLKVNYAVTMI